MQVWQLFHILQDYCNITKENPSLYCNMIKHLLQKQKIHGKQTIHSLTRISPTSWKDFFRDSIFTPYHADKLLATLKTIDEYLTTHGIVSIIHTPSTDYTPASILRNTSSSSNIPWKDVMFASTQSTLCNVAISLITGFSIGCLYAWFMNNNQQT